MASSRRVFLMTVAAGGAALSTGVRAQSMLEEGDPTALSLGYKADTTQVNDKKFPKHAASQNCSSCALYQGKAGNPSGNCAIFGAKQVAATGWCSAWAQKS